MTATISRLFDNYSTAQQAVRDLETAGVPHSEISIVASNADGWYAADRGTPAGVGTPDRVDRNANGIDDRAEGSGAGAGIGAVVGGAPGCLRAWVCSPFLDWALWSPLVGSLLLHWAP